MAISNSSVFEVRSTATAANANGGFYVPGSTGTDFSQQPGAQYNLTLVTTAAADAILLTASAADDMVGNGAHIIGTSNFIAGWYEIKSVVAGVSITLDRTCTTAAGANGTVNIGGALSLANLDDAVFESCPAGGGNVFHVKSGIYNINGAVSMSINGAPARPHFIKGYQDARGDGPTGSSRPTFNMGSVNFTPGTDWQIENMQFTGTATSVLTLSTNDKILYSKISNTSTTVDRVALTIATKSFVLGCEIQSYKGQATNANANTYTVDSCYLHDSKSGSAHVSATNGTYTNNIYKNFTTSGITWSGATTEPAAIARNTFHGCNRTATAILLGSGVVLPRIYDNNFSNFNIGVNHQGVENHHFDAYNNYFNNSANVVGWLINAGSITLDPEFAVTDVTGTNGSVSSSIITSAGKDFTALGVVAGRDFINFTAGTSFILGMYGITSVGTTTLTLDQSPGPDTAADKLYQISVGANFTPGTNLKAAGYPGTFPAGYSTSYLDIGAIQRIEPAAGGGGGSAAGIPTLRI